MKRFLLLQASHACIHGELMHEETPCRGENVLMFVLGERKYYARVVDVFHEPTQTTVHCTTGCVGDLERTILTSRDPKAWAMVALSKIPNATDISPAQQQRAFDDLRERISWIQEKHDI